MDQIFLDLLIVGWLATIVISLYLLNKKGRNDKRGLVIFVSLVNPMLGLIIAMCVQEKVDNEVKTVYDEGTNTINYFIIVDRTNSDSEEQ